ncbi:hypothetical protein GHK79_11850 [Enterococcus faecium]|uniref:hypothetical protein n=1 Tax=Enterococcus faecium TaxID=1352 RepID=UPI0019230AE6|nr:hypothetical protein [Enterococcus faecium]EHK9937329.1 hypothetical protein [Enterococcus faecium]EME3581667.1 hypothetical protein [Enterococcus faecium]MBL3708503.1 hypothetical protein [Enterococcus faecium]
MGAIIVGAKTGKIYFVENCKSRALRRLIERYPKPDLPEPMLVLRFWGEWSDEKRQLLEGEIYFGRFLLKN